MLKNNLDMAIAARNEISTLRPAPAPTQTPPALSAVRLVIAARVDGSDWVTINHQGASWKHGHWGWPKNVTIDGIDWDPHTLAEFPNSGSTAFLPLDVDFGSARVVSRSGRDVAALEKTDDGLTVIFSDSPNGSDNYSITIELKGTPLQSAAAPAPAPAPAASPQTGPNHNIFDDPAVKSQSMAASQP